MCRRLIEQDITCRAARSIEDAARNADVIITTTPARAPVIRGDWLAPGAHLNAMGADTAGKKEHEVVTLRDALVVVDDWAQACRLGECQHGLADGL